MRLLSLARDYAQSFSADKRSEEQMWRMGWGKPSVLISYFRECTLVSNLISSRCLCALNILPVVTGSIRSAVQSGLLQLPGLHLLLSQAVGFLSRQIPNGALHKWNLWNLQSVNNRHYIIMS